MDIPKVKAGDNITVRASTWNAFVDAANNNNPDASGSGGKGVPEHVLVRCKNTTFENVGRNEPVNVTGLLLDPVGNAGAFRAQPAFNVTAGGGYGSLGVTFEPIPAGRLGRVAFGGVVPCQVDIQSTDDDIAVLHGTASILKGHTQGAVGARILAKQNANLGEMWCLVQLGEYRSKYAELYMGQLAGAITSGSSTASVDNLSAMNGRPLSDASLTANNGFSWAAANNAPCLIGWNEADDQWELLQVKC